MSEPLSILYSARSWYGHLTAELHNSMKAHHDAGVRGYYICSNDKEVRYVHSLIGDDPNVVLYNVSEYFRDHWDEFTYEKFCQFEQKYEVAPIWKYIYTDRFLINEPRDYCISITTGYFMFYEEIYAHHRVDYFYDESISTIQTYIGYLIGLKNGCTYISQMTARGAGIDKELHYFINDPTQLDFEIDDSHPLEYYSEEERQKADEYLKNFEEHDLKPACMKISDRNRPKLNKRVLMCLPMYLYMRFDKYHNDKCYYIYYHHFDEAWKPLVSLIRYWRSKKYIHPVDYNQKFVYFPLHFQPESSTLFCAQKYEKQLFYIDMIAKGLPADTLLYIKEHGAMLGQRDLSFYKELKHYPNVVLVDPWENSRTLIEHAVATATLTGTAGLEAMFLRKPAFVGGRIMYEDGPGMIKIDDMYDRYYPEITKWKRPERDELIRYLCAYFRTLYPGTINTSADRLLEPDNIDLLATSLYNYCMLHRDEK